MTAAESHPREPINVEVLIRAAVAGGGTSLGVALRAGPEKQGWPRIWENSVKKQLWREKADRAIFLFFFFF